MQKTTSRIAAAGISVGLLVGATFGSASAATAATAATSPGTIDAAVFTRPGNVLVADEPTSSVALPDRVLTALDASSAEARTFTSYKLIDVVRTDNAVGSATIAHCVAATAGGTCTITAGVTVGVSVGVTLGATVQMVTASLSPGASASVTLSVGCSSPAMAAGESWDAHPVGTAYTYRIKKTNLFTGSQTSGSLTAFIPDANGIACGISS
jgi:hypothetical protein